MVICKAPALDGPGLSSSRLESCDKGLGMKRVLHVWVITVALVLILDVCNSLGQNAVTTQKKRQERSAAKIPIHMYTLKNGLRVVLSEDHSAPTYSICVTYD